MTNTQSLIDKVEANFDFTIEKHPLARVLSGRELPIYGLFRSDTGQLIGKSSVTERYVPHQKEHVMKIVEAAINAFGEASDVQCHFKGGHYVSIAPSRKHRKTVYGNDTVWPRIIIEAKLAGAGGYCADMAFWRDECSNLAMMKRVEGLKINIRHTNQLPKRVDDLALDLSLLKDKWQQMGNLIDYMTSKEVVVAEVISEIYPQPDDKTASKKRWVAKVNSIMNRLVRERASVTNTPQQPGVMFNMDGSYMKASAWEVYNAIQGYHQHDAPRRTNASNWDRWLSTAKCKQVLATEELLLAA